jgi:NADPH2:quinone reductase
VLATDGPDNQETLKSLGAGVTVDYTSQDFVEIAQEDTDGMGVDAVFDAVGGGTVEDSIAAARPFGRLATVLEAQGDPTPMYQMSQTLHGVLLHRERARLDALTALIERGQVEPLGRRCCP